MIENFSSLRSSFSSFYDKQSPVKETEKNKRYSMQGVGLLASDYFKKLLEINPSQILPVFLRRDQPNKDSYLIESMIDDCDRLVRSIEGCSKIKLNLFNFKVLESKSLTLRLIPSNLFATALRSILDDLKAYAEATPDNENKQLLEAYQELTFTYRIVLMMMGETINLKEESSYFNWTKPPKMKANRLLEESVKDIQSHIDSLDLKSDQAGLLLPGGYVKTMSRTSTTNAVDLGHTILYFIKKERQEGLYSFTLLNLGEDAHFEKQEELEQALASLEKERLEIEASVKQLMLAISQPQASMNIDRNEIASKLKSVQAKLKPLLLKKKQCLNAFKQAPVFNVQYISLSRQQLSDRFFSSLLSFLMSSRGALDMKEVNQFIESHLLDPNLSNRFLTRKHTAQSQNSCNVKPVFAWLRERIESTQPGFKVFMTQRQLLEIENMASSLNEEELNALTGVENLEGSATSLQGRALLDRMSEVGLQVLEKRKIKANKQN